MSKELLEKIDNMIERIAMNELHTGKSEDILIDKNTLLDIKKELELESIDNANPDKALECLEDIYRNGVFISDYDSLGKQHPTNISPETNKSISEQCDTIKQALVKAQEQEKVLSIIKEKNVDIKFLRTLINSDSEYTRKNALKIYNLCLDNEKLTKGEFVDLLKEFLG